MLPLHGTPRGYGLESLLSVGEMLLLTLRPMRLIRSLFALAVVAGMLGAPLGSPSAVAAVEEPIEAAVFDLTVAPAASGVLAPGDDLSLSVTLSNRSANLLPAGTVSVYFDSEVTGVDVLADWLGYDPATDGPAGGGAPVLQLPSPELTAGDVVEVPVVVPAAVLGLQETADFGARRIAVSVTSGGETIGGERSAVTIDPGQGFQSTPLALAMPLALPGASVGIISAELLESYTSVDGLLARQLDEAYGRPIAIGIDPRIIASIRLLGDTAPESAVEWLERLRSAPNETFPLTYADTDLAATSQASGEVLAPTGFTIDPALFPAESEDAGEPAPSPTPSATGTPMPLPDEESLLDWDYTLTGIAWPRESTVVGPDLETFAAAGLSTTILASDNVSIGALETSGAAAVIGEHEVLHSDDRISHRLREAVHAVSENARSSAIAELAAALAASVAEPGAEPKTVLATLDRESPLGGFGLSETLDALATLPWVSAFGLADALDEQPTAATVVDRPVKSERITRLQSLLAAEAATARFATVLVEPSLIMGERRRSLLALASQAWTIGETGWPAAVDEYIARSNEIQSSVAVVDSSTLNVIADRAELPINVSNDLDYPVTVLVTVRPQTPILNVLDSLVEVTIEANSQRRASVPVESIANGAVTIAISLSSPSGAPIAATTYTDLTVNAGWETAATAVLAVLVVVVFILGIIRTIRRRRRLRGRDERADAAAVAVAEPND